MSRLLGPNKGALGAGGLLVSQRLACTSIPLDLEPLYLLLLSPVSPGDCCFTPRTHPRVAKHQRRERGRNRGGLDQAYSPSLI